MSDPSLLTHRHVEVFRAVMTAGSVTGAAEALFTSQPTISRELSRMEHLLRLALFDRVRGRLQPTAQAYALFDEVQRSYAGLERVADTALRLRQFTEGQLSLACLPAFSHALLPGACARFQAAFPGVSVSVNPYESPLLEERLAAQAHDLGLTEHDTAHWPARRPRCCSSSTRWPCCPRATRCWPGRASRRPISPARPSSASTRATATAIGWTRCSPRLASIANWPVETDSAVAVCAMVQHGLGLAIVNPLTALAMAGRASPCVRWPSRSRSGCSRCARPIGPATRWWRASRRRWRPSARPCAMRWRERGSARPGALARSDFVRGEAPFGEPRTRDAARGGHRL